MGKYFLIKAGLRVSLLPLWSKSGVLTSAASLDRFLDRVEQLGRPGDVLQLRDGGEIPKLCDIQAASFQS